MNAQMRAIVCDGRGTLSVTTRPSPTFSDQPKRSWAKVRIKAFGVNRADLLQRAGHYPPPPGVNAEILGLEFAGVIEEVVTGEMADPIESAR
jgi:NADPH:quinone reductase-like Zn-dependent oxidoreductase